MKPRSGAIVVIGSINMDLVCRTAHIPTPGQTVLGGDLLTIPGGKGANQAVAAARLGGDVHMIGCVGGDDLGRRLRQGLAREGVHTEHVKVTRNAASGCAMILVDRAGENSIVVAPGANALLTPRDIDAARPLLRRAAVVVLQLEIPLATVAYAVALCRRLGVFTILDPAPAPRRMPLGLYRVDLLTPNESEAQTLLGLRRGGPRGTAAALRARGAKHVVLKLGSRGALLHTPDGGFVHAGGFKVKVVDTTAAGDAFTGALAVAIAQGVPLDEGVRFANAAGAICCRTLGAQPALPTREAVERLL